MTFRINDAVNSVFYFRNSKNLNHHWDANLFLPNYSKLNICFDIHNFQCYLIINEQQTIWNTGIGMVSSLYILLAIWYVAVDI